MMNNRILYIVGQLATGGLESQLFHLLQAMDRNYYEPAVAVWNYQKCDRYVSEIENLGVSVFGLSGDQSRRKKLKIIREYVRAQNPSLIHSFGFFTNFVASWVAWGSNAIPVGSIQTNFLYDIQQTGCLVGNLSGRFPRFQIVNNQAAVANSRRSRMPFLPKRLHVVRQGVNLDRFVCYPVPKNGSPRIVGVGSLLPIKRWDRILQATRELKGRGLDFQIRILGDGPLRDSLNQMSKTLQVADRVQFLGRVTNVPDELRKSSFVIHSSDSEGCPNSVLEAHACGRSVVATDVGDVCHLIDDGITGYVVDPNDQESLVNRMESLILDRNRCQNMGQLAREKALREFGLEKYVKRMFEAYRAAGWTAA